MSANLLSLNPSKTEFLIFGNSIQLSKLTNPALHIDTDTVIQPTATARNLGFLFDNHLSFHNQISSVCRSCNWHIHDLWRIRSTLDLNTTKTIATSIVHSKLDYCNSLYLNLPAYQLARLQCVQNSLARVVCKVPKHHHITPHLRSLHWLKIPNASTTNSSPSLILFSNTNNHHTSSPKLTASLHVAPVHLHS